METKTDFQKKFFYSGDHITLGQFLKVVDIAQSGGEAKDLLIQGGFLVNGTVETRRGRKLRHGDCVRFGHLSWLMVANSATL